MQNWQSSMPKLGMDVAGTYQLVQEGQSNSGSISWALLNLYFKTAVKHNHETDWQKASYLLPILQG
jgi:hypothetical protein